jgi:hypothetical protein
MATKVNSSIKTRWDNARKKGIEISIFAKEFHETRRMTHSTVVPLRVAKNLFIMSFMVQQAEAPFLLTHEEGKVTQILECCERVEDALVMAVTFLQKFEPITRLEFFAREYDIKRDMEKVLGALKGNVKDIATLAFGNEGSGTTILRRTIEEYSAVFYEEEYYAGIVFDQDGASNKKVRLILKEMQVVGWEEKRAETESSVDNMMWATAHYEGWARLSKLQKLLKRLAKRARTSVLDIVKTILQFWYEVGFTDEDMHLQTLIHKAIKDSKEDKAEVERRMTELVLVKYAGEREGTQDEETGEYVPPPLLSQEKEPKEHSSSHGKWIELPDLRAHGMSDEEMWNVVLERVKKVHQLVSITQVYLWTRERLVPCNNIHDFRRFVEKYFFKEVKKVQELELEEDSEGSESSYGSTDDEAESDDDEGGVGETAHNILPGQCTLHVEGIWGPTSMLRAVYTLPKIEDVPTILLSLQEHSRDLKMATQACRVMTQLASRGPPKVVEARCKMISDCGGISIFLNTLEIHAKNYNFVIACVDVLRSIVVGSVDVAVRAIEEERLPSRFSQLLRDFPGGLIPEFSKIQYTVYRAIMSMCLTGGDMSREFFARAGVMDEAMKALKGSNLSERFVQYTCGALLQIVKYDKLAYEIVVDPDLNRVTSSIISLCIILLQSRMVQKSTEIMFTIIALINQVLGGATMFRNKDIANTFEIKYPLEASIIELTRVVFRIMNISSESNLVKRCLTCLATCTDVSTNEVKAEVGRLGVHVFLLERLEEWLTQPWTKKGAEKVSVDPNQAIFGLQSLVTVTDGPSGSEQIKELALEHDAVRILQKAIDVHSRNPAVHSNAYFTLLHFMEHCDEGYQIFLKRRGPSQVCLKSLKKFPKASSMIAMAAKCLTSVACSRFRESPRATEAEGKEEEKKAPEEEKGGAKEERRALTSEKKKKAAEREGEEAKEEGKAPTTEEKKKTHISQINPRQACIRENALSFLLFSSSLCEPDEEVTNQIFECIAGLLSQDHRDRTFALKFVERAYFQQSHHYVFEKLKNNTNSPPIVIAGGFLLHIVALYVSKDGVLSLYRAGIADFFLKMLLSNAYEEHSKCTAAICAALWPFVKIDFDHIGTALANTFSDNQGVSQLLKVLTRFADDKCCALESVELLVAMGKRGKRTMLIMEKRGGVHASLTVLELHRHDFKVLSATFELVLLLLEQNSKATGRLMAGNFFEYLKEAFERFGHTDLRFFTICCKIAEIFAGILSYRKIMQSQMHLHEIIEKKMMDYPENVADNIYAGALRQVKLTVSQIRSRI